MSADLGIIHITPNQQAVTAQPTGSGFWGNIWDVVKTTATEMIKTGGNILLEKVRDNPPVVPSPSAPVSYPAYVPTKQSPEIVYNPNQSPTSKFATDLFLSETTLSKFLNPVIQPAVSEGIREGIVSVAQKPPVWVWAALGLVGVVILMQGIRR